MVVNMARVTGWPLWNWLSRGCPAKSLLDAPAQGLIEPVVLAHVQIGQQDFQRCLLCGFVRHLLRRRILPDLAVRFLGLDGHAEAQGGCGHPGQFTFVGGPYAVKSWTQ